MLDKKNILINVQNKDDKILYSKVIDQLIFCMKNYEITYTDFLPMLKYLEINSLLSKYHIEQKIEIFGGYEDAERVIIGFFPEYVQKEDITFPISILEISYNEKYSRELSHRDFLGSILGLGIDRSKVGDIVIKNNCAICFLSSDIINYVDINLQKVGSTKVKTKILELKDYKPDIKNLEEKNIIVSSTRLDAVLSGAFNISRGKSSDYIKGEKAFVNFVIESNPSKNIKNDDIISLRGFGKIKVNSIVGKTKKDRIVLSISKYV